MDLMFMLSTHHYRLDIPTHEIKGPTGKITHPDCTQAAEREWEVLIEILLHITDITPDINTDTAWQAGHWNFINLTF